MEYVDGKLNLYKGRELQVLTNDPPYPQMEAINKYWQAVGGANMLPGTVRSSDRFARADFFIKHVPANFEYAEALGCLSGIMGTVIFHKKRSSAFVSRSPVKQRHSTAVESFSGNAKIVLKVLQKRVCPPGRGWNGCRNTAPCLL